MEDFKDPLGKVPRLAIYRGKRVRIIGYEDSMFLILDHQDVRRKVRRDRLIFLKTKQ